MAATAYGDATVSKSEKKRMNEKLQSALSFQAGALDPAELDIGEYLPGTSGLYSRYTRGLIDGEDSEIAIYQEVDSSTKAESIHNKRLSSPDHFRYYFALGAPTGSLTDADFATLYDAADAGIEETEKVFRRWFDDKTIAGGIKAVTAIGRLTDLKPSALNEERSVVILRVLADIMDTGAPKEDTFSMVERRQWGEAKRFFRVLHNRLGGKASEVTETAFRDGKAIGWLVHLLRIETFSQGRYGERKRPESEWLLSAEEFDRVSTVMRHRFESMSFSEIFETPQPISLLFAWSQINDQGKIKKKFAEETRDNSQFVSHILRMSSQIESSAEGVFKVIKKDNISVLADPDAVTQRLNEIRRTDNDMRESVESILAKIKRGENF